jgi:hypothetical protein
MAGDILRKTGGWTVELNQPLKGYGREYTEIDIRPATADHVIRWAEQRIPSTFALLSELCNVPEKTLRQLITVDFDRVMMAFLAVMPPLIKADWDAGARPLATPEEQLPEVERYVPPPDQLDPRFPAVAGPVRRLQPKPPEPPPPDDVLPEGGMNMAMPDAIQPVLKHG